MDGNNVYYQAIKPVKEGKIELLPVHLETLSGLFTNLVKMKGMHNLVADCIKDEDRHDLIGKMVERKFLMSDL